MAHLRSTVDRVVHHDTVNGIFLVGFQDSLLDTNLDTLIIHAFSGLAD